MFRTGLLAMARVVIQAVIQVKVNRILAVNAAIGLDLE
jgi:hypothetical protein